MVFWLNSKVLEYGIRPESLHMILRTLAYRLPPGIRKHVPNSQLVHVGWDNVCHNLSRQNSPATILLILAYLVHLLQQVLRRR
jgi:hypothetical protein